MGASVTDLHMQAATPAPAPVAAPARRSAPLKSAGEVLRALVTGQLRQHYFADVRAFGPNPEAPRIVAAGYIALVSAVGILLSFGLVLAATPGLLPVHAMQAAAAALCMNGFVRMQAGQDPRPLLGWTVCLFLFSMSITAWQHAGILPPVMWTAPMLAAIVALFVRGASRLVALALACGVSLVVYLTSHGMIGVPSPYSPDVRSALSFMSLVFSTVGIGFIAWLSSLSRDVVVDQLKAANVAILESSARSRIALEAAKVGLWDVPNLAERRFHVTESFQSITGYTDSEFNRIFEALDEFIHPDDISALREAFALGRKRLSRVRVDFRLMTRSRGYRWFSARARHARNADGSIRISGSLQDIHFIKAAEDALRTGRDRAREASQAKSHFIAVMSHEVRTPLNAILGSVQVLKRGEHGAQTAELVGLIDDAGLGLLRIVNDMLDVSRMEAGKTEITPTPVNLVDLVARQVETWRAEADARGLRLEADLAGGSDAMVLADAGRIRQIIGNLLSNALKFTDAGGVTVRLNMATTTGETHAVEIAVADTGPGVPAAFGETIFEPFEQGPGSDPRGGAGLGLYISRRFARMMGGDLTVDELGAAGACFRLKLDVGAAGDIAMPDTMAETEQAWTGRTVLCVDDNPANRRIAELLLAQFGLVVTTCASGAEAIEACRDMRFDMLMLDIVMPGMDGMEALRRVRADEAGLNQGTPAMALTAKLSADDLTAYLAAGFASVAGKPIDVTELARAMTPLLRPPANPSSSPQ